MPHSLDRRAAAAAALHPLILRWGGRNREWTGAACGLGLLLLAIVFTTDSRAGRRTDAEPQPRTFPKTVSSSPSPSSASNERDAGTRGLPTTRADVTAPGDGKGLRPSSMRLIPSVGSPCGNLVPAQEEEETEEDRRRGGTEDDDDDGATQAVDGGFQEKVAASYGRGQPRGPRRRGGGDDRDGGSYHTPTSRGRSIPADLRCPPAPRKEGGCRELRGTVRRRLLFDEAALVQSARSSMAPMSFR